MITIMQKVLQKRRERLVDIEENRWGWQRERGSNTDAGISGGEGRCVEAFRAS